MLSKLLLAATALATGASAHATFQAIWINGVDYGSSCIRLPLSNSPVTDVTSNNLACNVGTSPAKFVCNVNRECPPASSEAHGC
jgi:cellulase